MNKLDSIKESSFSYILLTPVVLLFLIFGLFPLLYSLWLSLWNYKLNTPSDRSFVGLGNYMQLLQDSIFLSSLAKTAYYTSATVLLSIGIGLVVALVLNRDFFGKSFFLLAMIVPWAIPNVVNGIMWKWIYDGNYGVFNWFMLKIGLISEYKWWFIDSAFTAMSLVIVADVWKNIPFIAILLLTGLQAIPKDLYEAAKCDGANAFKQFLHVTMPGIRNILMVVFMIVTMWALKAFDLIYTLTHGGPGHNTTITYFYVYQQAFDYLNLGYGSALAYFVTLLIIVFALFYYKMIGNEKE